MTATKKRRSRQLAFRVKPELAEDVDSLAEALGLDLSNFLRLVLQENLIRYKRRVEQMKSGIPTLNRTTEDN